MEQEHFITRQEMRITIATVNDEIASLDVHDDMTLIDLLALAQVDVTSLAAFTLEQLQVMHNGRPLMNSNNKTLKELGVVNEDMMLILPKKIRSPPQQQGRSSGGQTAPRSTERQELERTATELLQKFNDDANLRAMVELDNPTLAEMLKSNDTGKVVGYLEEVARKRHEAIEMERRLLIADPFDIEAQKMIEDRIRRERVDQSYMHAMEHTPEVFTQVHMLYINTKINGVPIKVFVDCGAQTTIISSDCARRCNLMHMLDERFHGIAQGVGTQKILGRIHWAQMQIDNVYMHCSFSVMDDQTMDVLLGLDMLKRHQCCIDLKKNILHIGSADHSTPFLSEHELPVHARFGVHGGTSPNRPGPSAPAPTPAGGSAGTSTATSTTNSGASSNAVPSPAVLNGASDPKIRRLMEKTGIHDERAAKEALEKANGDLDLASVQLLTKNIFKKR